MSMTNPPWLQFRCDCILNENLFLRYIDLLSLLLLAYTMARRILIAPISYPYDIYINAHGLLALR
jgi:hypothetical protein